MIVKSISSTISKFIRQYHSDKLNKAVKSLKTSAIDIITIAISIAKEYEEFDTLPRWMEIAEIIILAESALSEAISQLLEEEKEEDDPAEKNQAKSNSELTTAEFGKGMAALATSYEVKALASTALTSAVVTSGSAAAATLVASVGTGGVALLAAGVVGVAAYAFDLSGASEALVDTTVSFGEELASF